MTIMYSSNNSECYVFSLWRKSILQQLNEREKHEMKPFQKIVQHCNKLFESTDAFRTDYLHTYPKYGAFNSDVINQTNHQVICEKCPSIEKKLFSYQEELTTLHRKKDELSTKNIILNDQISKLEKEKKAILAESAKSQDDILNLKLQIKKLEFELSESKNSLQLLKDEYESLQLAYNSLNKNYSTLDQEHKELISRVMVNKAKDAERLNIENEKIVRLQDELRRKELEVAAREMRISTDDKVNSLNNLINADSPVILAKIPSQILFTHDAHDGEVNALKWVTDSEKYHKTNVLATGGADRKVKLWLIGTTTATILDTFTNSNASITSIDVDGDCLLASSSDFASRLWTINDSRLRRTFTGHSSKVTAVKFLGKPTKSVSGSYDRTIKIWDINKHVCIRTLFAGSSCNDLVTRQGQESEVISGHFDKSIRFWDVRTDSSANSIQLQGKITSLTILPNSFQLLSSDRGDTLKLLDLRMNQVIRNYYADGFKIGCDWTRACVSPDGEYVVAGSSDGIVYIWNTLSGKIEKELKGAHTSNVNACSWSPNCQYFVSCDKNKKFAIWVP